MKHVDLRISYRDGRPCVGYLYLSDPRVITATAVLDHQEALAVRRDIVVARNVALGA